MPVVSVCKLSGPHALAADSAAVGAEDAAVSDDDEHAERSSADAAARAMPNRRVDALFTLVSLILQVAWVNGCSPMLGPVMDPRLPLTWPGPHPEAPHRGLQGLSDS